MPSSLVTLHHGTPGPGLSPGASGTSLKRTAEIAAPYPSDTPATQALIGPSTRCAR
jgi:hypothetical protein